MEKQIALNTINKYIMRNHFFDYIKNIYKCLYFNILYYKQRWILNFVIKLDFRIIPWRS